MRVGRKGQARGGLYRERAEYREKPAAHFPRKGEAFPAHLVFRLAGENKEIVGPWFGATFSTSLMSRMAFPNLQNCCHWIIVPDRWQPMPVWKGSVILGGYQTTKASLCMV